MAKWPWKNDVEAMVEQDVELRKCHLRWRGQLELEGEGGMWSVRAGHLSPEYGFCLILWLKVDLHFSLYIFLYYM